MTHDPKTLHRFLTPDLMRDVLQAAGYRVAEGQAPDGSPVLASATGGLGFEVRFFNPLTPARKGRAAPGGERTVLEGETQVMPEGAAFADMGLRTAFRVQGELPLTLVNAWNVSHRFARLLLVGGGVSAIETGAPNTAEASNAWLVLEMDVVALGGVLADNLRAQAEIWDRLVQELIAWLRAELPKLAKAAPVAEPQVSPVAAGSASDAEAPSPLPAA